MKNDQPDLSSLTREQLLAELARRSVTDASDMSGMERANEALASELKTTTMATRLRGLEDAEDSVVSRPCPKCGRGAPVKARRRCRKLVTLSGMHELRRNYHYCSACRHGWYPLDEELRLPEDGELTAEVERRLLDFGLHDTFGDAAERWAMHYTGISASENLMRLVVERVGLRVERQAPSEVHARLNPSSEDPASLLIVGVDGCMLPTRGDDPWREAKVAVIYRAENLERKGARGRGCIGAARYAAVIGSRDALETQLEAALAAEGAERAQQAVFVGDGASWVWNVAEALLPDAHQVLDWWHVAEHVAECGRALLDDDGLRSAWCRRVEDHVWNGELDYILFELEACVSEAGLQGTEAEAIQRLVAYLESHEDRLNYAVFREVGFPIGSGFVESAHRHVLHARMKRSGQRWDVHRGNRMAGLRAALRTTGPQKLYEALQPRIERLAA